MNFSPIGIQKIKLIIWDLDETFWKGTLSDYNGHGTVCPIPEHITLVKELAKRGIVNSICSKNEYIDAQAKLSELGVWDYFVFCSINWDPKGQRIKKLINAMALREENVLFIDDNISNLKEAEFFCPAIMVAPPSVTSLLTSNISCIGKTDLAYSRLKQYKILEKKQLDAQLYSSNSDFLKQSGIKICFNEKLEDDIARIHELIQRSNQLNFTKKRVSPEELESLIKDPSIRTGSVSVSDNYGIYGLVGFYAVSQHSLIHFLFSCRTMGMGIEQYVYASLNYPDLQIVGPVSGNVSKEEGKPSYITEVSSLIDTSQANTGNCVKILLKGPCDLQVMASYILNTGNITTEFNFIDDNGNQADFFNHSINILNSRNMSIAEKEEFCQRVPFVSMQAFDTDLFSGQYDVIVLSPLMDATLAVYEDTATKIKFPFGLYNKPLTDSDNWQDYIDKKVMTARCSFNRSDLERFCKRFSLISLAAQDIANNFKRIINEILATNQKTKFVILLLSELPYKGGIRYELMGKECIHKNINQALRQAFSQMDAVYLLDVNKYIHKQNDYFDNINHYSKLVYYHMAQELIELINQVNTTALKATPKFKALKDNLKRLIYKIISRR